MSDYLLAAGIVIYLARWLSDSPRVRVGARLLWRRITRRG